MRKIFISLAMTILIFLVGCSAVQDVTNTVNYMDEATEYIETVNNFTKQAPSLIEQAAQDKNARQDLITQLQTLQKEMQQFNQLTPPDFAADLHNQVKAQNEQVAPAVSAFLKVLQSEQIDLKALQNTDLIQALQQYNDLMKQVQQLNQQ